MKKRQMTITTDTVNGIYRIKNLSKKMPLYYKEGEDYREVKEECGFEPDPSKIKYAGKFDYLPVKDLEVFVCPVSSAEMKSMIEIAKCNSYFTNPSGVEQPEVDDYKVCKIDDFNLNYQRVIKNALSGVTY